MYTTSSRFRVCKSRVNEYVFQNSLAAISIACIPMSLADRNANNLRTFTKICLFANIRINNEKLEDVEIIAETIMAQMSANNNIPIASTTECGGDSNHLAVHFDYNAFELSWQPGVYVYTFRLEGYINRMEPFTLLTLWNVGKYGVVEAESLYSSVQTN